MLFKSTAITALGIATLAVTAPAMATSQPAPATSVTYDYFHGALIVTDTGKDVINVARGASFNISGSWLVTNNGGGYCPGCVIQLYLAGIGGPSGQANLVSSTGISGSGVYSATFIAPTTAGTYFIGMAERLNYSYVSVSGSGYANADNQASYQINDAVPETATWTMMLLGLGSIGFATRRRQIISLTYA